MLATQPREQLSDFPPPQHRARNDDTTESVPGAESDGSERLLKRTYTTTTCSATDSPIAAQSQRLLNNPTNALMRSERALTVCVTAIGAVRIRLDEFADRKAVGRLIGRDGEACAHEASLP